LRKSWWQIGGVTTTLVFAGCKSQNRRKFLHPKTTKTPKTTCVFTHFTPKHYNINTQKVNRIGWLFSYLKTKENYK